MTHESLADYARFWSRTAPARVAVIDGDRDVTWRELDDRTTSLARGLRGLGLSKGDRIGIVAPNCLEFLEVVLAACKLGAVTVPLNQRLIANELQFILEHAGCSAVVVHPDHVEAATKAADGIDRDLVRIGLAAGFGTTLPDLRTEGDHLDVEIDSTDVAFICYTSGTTGQPKGAMLTHANVLATAHFRNLADDLGQRARLYLPAPLSFTGTLVMLWAVNYVGGGLTVLDSVVDARRSLEAIQRHRITDFVAVPVVWERMLRDEQFASFDISSLRTCLTGGATVTESFLRSVWDAGIPVRNSYGLTEGASCSTWQSVEDSKRQPSSVGRATIHNAIRIVAHNESGLETLASGEVGEIAVRGPEVMLGYWRDPEATASTLVDGWLLTGDLGRLTDDGFLHVVGRAKDMLISGGLNVYPAEIEDVLASLAGVAECAVIGVSDEQWGETPAAIVCPEPGVRLEPAAVRAHCIPLLADFKLPRYVVVRERSLPRSAFGKILKRELLEEYSTPELLGPRLR